MDVEKIYFEDIVEGMEISGPVRYEVTKDEIVAFAARWDPRPFHLDEEAAASSVFGGLAACSAHIFSIFSWFAARGGVRIEVLSALGFDGMRMQRPVLAGDVLSCTTKFIDKRESQSRANGGIARYHRTLVNQHGQVVCSLTVASIVEKRPRPE